MKPEGLKSNWWGWEYRAASRKQILERYEWFISTLDSRLVELDTLFQSRGGEGKLNRRSTSLRALATWLKANVEYRQLTEDEIAFAKASSPTWLHESLNAPILTNYWVERSADVGAYFGEVLRKSFPSLEWGLSRHSRKHANFGQPVLVRPSGLEVPVITKAHVFMTGLHRNPDPATHLIMLFHRLKGWIGREFPESRQ